MNLSDHDRMGQLFTFHPLYYAVLDEKTGKHVTGKRIGNRHNYAAILSPQRKPALWASEDEAWIDTDRLFDPNRKYNVDFIIFNEEGFKVLDVKRTI